LGNQLILNGDIVVYDFSVQSTMSYTKDDETHTFGKDDLYRWPGATVPVVLDNSVFQSDNYIIIKSALNFFNFNTGIIFKERTNEEDYLVITCINDDGSGRGGFTAVGRQRNGSNILRLVNGNFNKGTVLHELMHTLGLFHEQARTDRDNFVSIEWNNVKTANSKDFQIEDNGTIRSPYDYCSIMQYSTMAFAIDNTKPTITCKTNGVATPCPGCMGSSNALTQMDRDGLDKFYGEMGISRFPCQTPFVSSKLPVAGCIGVDDILIRNKWDFYKGQLGDCQSGVISMGILNTTYVQFERGQIYHSPHGVYAVYGDIYQLFAATNGMSKYGFPISDESDVKDAAKGMSSWQKAGYTRASNFEKGVIVWGPAKKARALTTEDFAAGPHPFKRSVEANENIRVARPAKTTTEIKPVRKIQP
jgi:astacin (peptidase family M12A)